MPMVALAETGAASGVLRVTTVTVVGEQMIGEPREVPLVRARIVDDRRQLAAVNAAGRIDFLDREQRAVRVVAYALVVPIERSTVGGVRSREGRHRDGSGISPPLEDLVEIGVLEPPESDPHADTL